MPGSLAQGTGQIGKPPSQGTADPSTICRWRSFCSFRGHPGTGTEPWHDSSRCNRLYGCVPWVPYSRRGRVRGCAQPRVRARARSSSEKLDALFSQGPIHLQYRPREPSSVGSRGMRCRTSMPPCQWPAASSSQSARTYLSERRVRREAVTFSGSWRSVLAARSVGGRTKQPSSRITYELNKLHSTGETCDCGELSSNAEP